ncbi:bifunctional 3-(3-hydroxy-phenyl)propionate/3-hydroxycinnamic acid hydroxylase [Streptomyces sp. NBC_01275]|uniref:bifunctional 3-(3-hydroxy-phenyl)propionate/3-hydroxycinnamic acid hydroxylase MhpA n=1 Tax=Streptomyces sp. NBC_01275 TaxID=2903807 RepID=UPI002256C754|nr:bifunctional 3-(3-hydroxy-phenyl)propionate/3-hydroxycinnamic acid hydroxylase [Streptomyces sp. NBC_01275]MCX4761565.1 bifunctional 3-(3-hydroxy-phenyl)propionate/3-hydroxycinnamic acid hydroxylase [Streptomyces sp. NBC_01275]
MNTETGAVGTGAQRWDADVLVVGDGPVGQTLAIMLARQGWAVTVVDRWPEPYTMSRAVAFDSEAARVLASIGLTQYIATETEPSGRYVWQNGDGKVLLDIQGAQRGWCHWPDSTSMYQPALESALTARGAQLPTLRVLRGHEAVDAADLGDHVELTCVGPDGGRRVLSARMLVGCDGANSFVRERVGGALHDLDFAHDWLICDVVLHEERAFDPNNLQICDPARPRTEASAGPGHRRWEFMRLDGESLEQLNTPESAWRLLELFDVTPQNATLLRHAVYTFRSRWAERWRSGRMLIAGDAAHVMPPFAGQGMCSGIRDAANLSWKLDLVLRGRADETLLDTYVTERAAHVRHAVRMSVDLGKVICQLDPVAAADRDMAMLAARERGVGRGAPQAPVHPLRDGLLRTPAGSPRSHRLTGSLTPQARVRRNGRTTLFDETLGTGFTLLTTEDPRPHLTPEALGTLESLDVRVVTVVPADSGVSGTAGDASGTTGDASDATVVVADVDGVYLPYLANAGAHAVLVRPDFYVFGQSDTPEDCSTLLEDLGRRLEVGALTH